MRLSNFSVSLLGCALALAVSVPALAQSSATNSQSQSAPTQSAPAQPPSTQQSAPAENHAQSQANDDNPLNLTEDQKNKLRPIIMDENQQLEVLRNDTSMTQEQKIAKANQIRAEASPKIKAILTPEQLQKLAQMQQERMRQQQNSQAPAGNAQPPQSSPPPQR